MSCNFLSPDQVDSGPLPSISPADQNRLVAVPGPDQTGEGLEFGDLIQDAQPSYNSGEVVSVIFEGANPRHNMKVVLQNVNAMTIAVPAKKFSGSGDKVLLKFCDIWPNHDFLVLYGYDKKTV